MVIKKGYKIYKQGKSYVIYFPKLLLTLLGLDKGDRLTIYAENGKIFVERGVGNNVTTKGNLITTIRLVGRAKKDDDVYGITIPASIVSQIRLDVKYTFNLIEKRKDGYFKMALVPVGSS